jgi:hypothetical protein
MNRKTRLKKKYSFEKAITADSKRITRLKKKYGKRKFTPEELFGYD